MRTQRRMPFAYSFMCALEICVVCHLGQEVMEETNAVLLG